MRSANHTITSETSNQQFTGNSSVSSNESNAMKYLKLNTFTINNRLKTALSLAVEDKNRYVILRDGLNKLFIYDLVEGKLIAFLWSQDEDADSTNVIRALIQFFGIKYYTTTRILDRHDGLISYTQYSKKNPRIKWEKNKTSLLKNIEALLEDFRYEPSEVES